MQPGPFTTHNSRTLLLDVNNEHGGQLVEQLNHAGFKTDFAVSWGAAHAAFRANCYQSCIVVADLDQPAILEQLDELRRAALHVWIIVLSDRQPENARVRALQHCVDAVLSAPFSMENLTSRLAAFSLRARPAC
jgi:DNA-binding response OmpR family regulator